MRYTILLHPHAYQFLTIRLHEAWGEKTTSELRKVHHTVGTLLDCAYVTPYMV